MSEENRPTKILQDRLTIGQNPAPKVDLMTTKGKRPGQSVEERQRER